MTRAVTAAALLAVAAGCRRAPPPPAPSGTQTEALGADSAAGELRAPPPLVGPARCRPTDWGVPFDVDGGSSDLDVGDVVPVGDAVAVALVRRVAGDRVAAVAFVQPDRDDGVRLVDLGPTLGDAPPPRLAPRGGEVVAVIYPLQKAGARGPGAPVETGGAGRTLQLRALTADGASTLFSLDEPRDDSLATDVAVVGDRGLVVWDEATSEPRGIIRGAPFAGRQRVGATLDLSPKDSDADSPRAVPFGKGYAVAWIARAPDPDVSLGDGSDFEVPGETRTRGWVELVLVDDRGTPTGPPRRLTAPTGHVSAFDLLPPQSPPAPAGVQGAAPTLLVVARDDGETVDGSGGTLLRVRVGAELVEPPVAFTHDGLGRGAPLFIEGPATWLTWVGPAEHMRLLGLDASGAPGGLPSAEEAMDETRPVLGLRSGNLLVEAPADPVRQLRTFSCAPKP